MQTISERLFEQFCTEHQLRFAPVPRATLRTPDYDVHFGSQRVVVEVKQVDPSPEDAIGLAKFAAVPGTLFGGEPGKRVRQEITDAKRQLSRHAKGQAPALLVLYNNAEPIHYLDPMFILLGMYGELMAHVSTSPPGEDPALDRLTFGGKRMVSESHNTTISAVCVLINDPLARPTLTFYHNSFAALPFQPEWCRSDQVKHYILPKATTREFDFWEAI
jgi:hypothetical protein